MQPDELDDGLPPLSDEPTPEQEALTQDWLNATYFPAREAEHAFRLALCGSVPEWVTENTWLQVEGARHQLSEGLTDDQILACVDRESEGFVPGNVDDSVAFLRLVAFLALIRDAVSLGPKEGLKVLYGPDASGGYRSHAASQRPRGPKWYVAPLQECLAALAADFEQRLGHAPTLKELVREGEREYGNGDGFQSEGGAVVRFCDDAALRITAPNRRPISVQHQNLYPHLPPAIRR